MKIKITHVLLIAFSLFALAMFVLIKVDEKKADNGKLVIGKIVAKERTKYVIHFTYSYEGKDYKNTTLEQYLFDYIKPEELFMVSVDTDNPKNSLIYFDKPVMTTDKQICETSAKVEVDDRLNSNLVEFVYEANEKQYKRMQMTAVEDRAQYAGKSFLVKYYCDNPSVGYVFLDSLPRNAMNTN